MNRMVVYLLIPTSNHNYFLLHKFLLSLYIFWFLHQTTTILLAIFVISRCISFDSYIKPQLLSRTKARSMVVYLLIPTSNHNHASYWVIITLVVYLLIPTSNHNGQVLLLLLLVLYIFWFLHQTTTLLLIMLMMTKLYIFWFLHQTTTMHHIGLSLHCCISFDSYIKPQLINNK